ncbi:OB-fold domain-containing protein [Roseomonas sp. OT10]|uniref:Zn-ribbon domain-containing OB-fold protein n=1 Tax=Roseomonas cutis TaxID=2897332 RepID=UPI001E2C2D8A|nr:OB-fold domain-containing protein [Roseomonas sp. OT10]UFN48426.1 OB-fold domain-containing protein [Roseomonas sp. OT10]
MDTGIASTPAPVMGLYDRPMWQSIRERRMQLQRCRHCGTWQYPPGPACSACLSEELEWSAISGKGSILSWVIFHRQYLPAYPAPYNVIAVQLDEGPVMISNLEGPAPDGSWIGRRVELVFHDMPDGAVLPRFRLEG